MDHRAAPDHENALAWIRPDPCTHPITSCHNCIVPRFRSHWSLEEPGKGKSFLFPWTSVIFLATADNAQYLARTPQVASRFIITFKMWNISIPPLTDLITNKNSLLPMNIKPIPTTASPMRHWCVLGSHLSSWQVCGSQDSRVKLKINTLAASIRF